MPYKDKEKQRKTRLEYYKKNRDSILKYHRDWYNKKKKDSRWLVERRRKMRKYARNRRVKLRMKVIELLGGKCIKCGNKDIRVLQIDHIHCGGSNRKRKKERNNHGTRKVNGPIGGYETYLLKILKEIKVDGSKYYQLLCANCNWIKRWENEERY